MAQINFNLKQEYIDAVCSALKYDPLLEPLETQQQFVERKAKDWLKRVARNYLEQSAIATARAQVAATITGIGD
jgi:hypothetical protein